MFLYALNYFTGFDAWTMDEVKGYGSAKINGYTTISHGHLEIEIPGVEVTIGHLGQGVANSVSFAIASKNLAARYNRPGYDVVRSRIYCMTGDGCLIEGVALEAISLADWINTEDVNTKIHACGWHGLKVADGCYDVQAIVVTLNYGKTLRGKPVFINIHTIIGLGTQAAGIYKVHYDAFDKESIARSKQLAGQDPSVTHVIPPASLKYFRERKSHRESPENGLGWSTTREANSILLEKIWKAYPGGGADLINSNKAAPGVRMGGLSHLPVTTHDSFVEGPVPLTSHFKVEKGAYVIKDIPGAKLTLVNCGTNLYYAVAAAESLTQTGVSTGVVSCLSFEHFDKQGDEYRTSVFPLDGAPIVSVEDYSASNPSNYNRFGINAKGIERRVRKYLEELKSRTTRIAGWRAI
ncbi:hypothetical protein B7463_g7085, partial [Scytalidium lignicola]